MSHKFTFKASVLCMLSFFCLFNAQKSKEGEQIVFGKIYTLKELQRHSSVIRCASTEYEAMLQQKDSRRATTDQFESWIKPLIENAKQSKSQNGGIITIPVVVHVIHNGQALGVGANISDAQVQSQITVLNNDYRKMNGTPGFNTNPVGADVMIQFALAKVDPNGNPTDGIDRVNLCQNSWIPSAIESYVKPITIWDPTKYMNMWSLNFSTNGLLGYAQFPSNSGLAGLNNNYNYDYTDGVVADYTSFGSRDYDVNNSFQLSSGYDKGRTMTHEVGHFLGLKHIWGDDGNPNVCATDYCDDTPPAHQDNSDCTTPIASCTPGLNEMVENYMDYTLDACMNIFTINQKDRITAVMNNSPRRKELKTSVADQPIPLFANDAELKGERSCSQSSCGNTENITVQYLLYNRGTGPLTSAEISYSVNGGASQTYSWNGNLGQNKYALISISSGVSEGAVSAEVVSVNGGADQRATNNRASVVVGNSVPVLSTTFTFELQRDPWGSETTWTLKNSAGTTLYNGAATTNANPNYPALFTQTWNLPLNDCYTFTINDSANDGIYQFDGYYRVLNSAGNIVVAGNQFTSTQSRTFKVTQALSAQETVKNKSKFEIYPNPVTDIINIRGVSGKAQFKIHSVAGRLIKSGSIEAGKVKVSDLIKGSYIITVEDNLQSESIKFIKK